VRQVRAEIWSFHQSDIELIKRRLRDAEADRADPAKRDSRK
jgi:hypothetical protein